MTDTQVLIIGGGVAGLKCASILENSGVSYHVVERENRFGGHLSKWHSLFPFGELSSSLLSSIAEKVDQKRILTGKAALSINRESDGSFCTLLQGGETIRSTAVVISTGFSLFDATKKEEYGYKIFNGVLTNADLERWFAGDLKLEIDSIKKVGFVHCVGSRDAKIGNIHCSKVCCITAVKQAIELKKQKPHLQIFLFYMDLRMFGRGYEELYLEAQSKWGIRFIRGRVSEVSQNHNGELVVKAEDTLSSRPLKLSLNLLVLMSGMVPDASNNSLLKSAALNLGSDGFVKPGESLDTIGKSAVPGLYSLGALNGPARVPEVIAESYSVSFQVLDYLKERANG